MAHLVGFHGPMRSGKDTACEILTEALSAHGKVVRREAFADRLKVSAARALGAPAEWSVDQCVAFCNELKENGEIYIDFSIPGSAEYVDIGVGMQQVTPEQREPWDEHPRGISGRQYLQWYGTEAHRQVFETDFWVDALLPRPAFEEFGKDFKNAASEMLLKNRFPDVDVVAVTDVRFPNEAQRILELGGDVIRIWRPGVAEFSTKGHTSEAGLPQELTTWDLINDGTLEDLTRKVNSTAVHLGLFS